MSRLPFVGGQLVLRCLQVTVVSVGSGVREVRMFSVTKVHV